MVQLGKRKFRVPNEIQTHDQYFGRPLARFPLYCMLLNYNYSVDCIQKWVWPHEALLGLADCRSVNLLFLKRNILYLSLGRQFQGIWWQSIYATSLRCVSILVRWLFSWMEFTLCLCPKLLICFCEWNWTKHLICPAYLANHGIQKGLPLVCFAMLCGAVARTLAFPHLVAWMPVPVTAPLFEGWVCRLCSELDCSQSPIFPWDRRDFACHTINDGYLYFQMYLGGGRRGLYI